MRGEIGEGRDCVSILDRHQLGFNILAFVEVKVPQVADAALSERFQEAVLKEPAIVGCYITTASSTSCSR